MKLSGHAGALRAKCVTSAEPKSAHVPLMLCVRVSNLLLKRDAQRGKALEREKGRRNAPAGKQRTSMDAFTKGDKNIIGCGASVRSPVR